MDELRFFLFFGDKHWVVYQPLWRTSMAHLTRHNVARRRRTTDNDENPTKNMFLYETILALCVPVTLCYRPVSFSMSELQLFWEHFGTCQGKAYRRDFIFFERVWSGSNLAYRRLISAWVRFGRAFEKPIAEGTQRSCHRKSDFWRASLGWKVSIHRFSLFS